MFVDIVPLNSSYIKEGALWVGDEKMISRHVNDNKELLMKSGWELDAKEIFDNIIHNEYDHGKDKELYHFICELFNSWCLFCEGCIWKKGYKEPFSVNPFDPEEF